MIGNFSKKTAYGLSNLETEVMTASRHRLAMMLFIDVVDSLKKMSFCIQKINEGNKEEHYITEKGRLASRIIDIFENGLKAPLNMNQGGELAERLFYLYEYLQQRVLYAHLKNKSEELDAATQIMSELRDAWESIEDEV